MNEIYYAKKYLKAQIEFKKAQDDFIKAQKKELKALKLYTSKMMYPIDNAVKKERKKYI